MVSENSGPPIAMEQLIRFLGMGAVWFDCLFVEHLLLVNVMSAAVLLGIGDLTVQTIVLNMADHQRQGRSSGYNIARNRRTMIIGCFLGLFEHIWYEGLDHYIRGSSFNVVLKKVLVDQCVARPFFSSAFTVGMCILEGLPPYLVYKEWKDTFTSIYKADWKIWPAAQIVNFYLLPAKYRVVCVNAVTLLWNSYLSYKKHDHTKDEGDATENGILCLETEAPNNSIFHASKKAQWSPTTTCPLELEPQNSFQNRLTSPDSPYGGTPKKSGRGADPETADAVTKMPTSGDQVIDGDSSKDSLRTGMAGEPLLVAYAPSGAVGVSKGARNLSRTTHKTTPTHSTMAGNRTAPKAVKRKKILAKTKSGAVVKKQAAALHTGLKENASNRELQNKVTDMCQRVQYLTEAVISSQRSLELAIRETRRDVNKLGLAQIDVLSMVEETKRGLVNIAKHIVAAVRLEGQKGSETIAKYVEDAVNKFELKVQNLRHPEGNLEPTGRSQETTKQFSFL